MAGILAISSSKSMTAGETAVNDVESGYLTNEQIALSTTPTGSSYAWALAIPSGSTVARSGLSSETASGPTFTPDVEGEYVVTCVVDSTTTYTLRCTVVATSVVSIIGSMRLLPRTDASVPTPSTGETMYYSSDQSSYAVKDSSGNVYTLDKTGPV